MDEKVTITMEFPNHKMMMEFCVWMCDEGGEQEYMDACENVGSLQYHSEDPAFATNDPKRYGKFMADNKIIIHEREDE